MTKLPKPVAIVVCCAAVIFFISRGPYRALRYPTAGDFSTIYAAARCWMHGENPYDRIALEEELTRAGAPDVLRREQEVNPSVYLPPALALGSPFALAGWPAANFLWCAVSVLLFALSIGMLLCPLQLRAGGRWLAAAAALLFSPSYVGVYDGNPSVISIALITLAVLSADSWASGLLLGIACCFKPQLALCGFCLFVLQRRWRSIALAIALFGAATLIGVFVLSCCGRGWTWWEAERRNIAISFAPGGTSDPTPSSSYGSQLLNLQAVTSYLSLDARVYNGVAWAIVALLFAIFLRKRRPQAEWYDAAFVAPATLLITYHRYYDAQLLLLALPFLVVCWRARRIHVFRASALCLLLLAFPFQSILARHHTAIRFQPLALAALATIFALSGALAETEM